MAPTTTLARLDPSPGSALDDLQPGPVIEALAGPGAVLLRGYRGGAEAFERFSQRCCDRFHPVAARARWQVPAGDGQTSRAPPVNFTLLVHSEGTYQPFRAPDLAFFWCQEAPAGGGGETLLADGRLFYRRLPPALRRRFEGQGAIFEALWEPARWQAEFGIQEPAEMAGLEQRYPGLACSFEGPDMRYRYRRPVIHDDRHGERVFANAILAHLPEVDHPAYVGASPYAKPTNRVFFGDGEPLGRDCVNALIDIQDDIALGHAWREGDLLVIDNRRVMHGRRPTVRDEARTLLTRFGHLRAHWRGPGFSPSATGPSSGR